MEANPTAIVSKTCNTCTFQFKTVDDFLERGSGWRVCTSDHLWFECACGSTLLLRKGNYDWYSPTLFLRNSSLEALESDQNALLKLPHLATGLMVLQQSIRNPNHSSEVIAENLRKTPAIAAEVFKMANQIRTGSEKISSLAHAISYLGRSTISHLVLTASLQSFRFQTTKFSCALFWQEAFLTGMITEVIAKHFAPHITADTAYLAGSLCNIGKLVSAICYPEATDEIVRILANPKTMTTWLEAEQSQQVPDHLTLGDIAAIFWGLPKDIRKAILFHHQGTQAKLNKSKGQLNLPECVGFSCLLMHWLALEPHRIDETQLNQYRDCLGWTEKQLESFVNRLAPLKTISESQVANSKLLH